MIIRFIFLVVIKKTIFVDVLYRDLEDFVKYISRKFKKIIFIHKKHRTVNRNRSMGRVY